MNNKNQEIQSGDNSSNYQSNRDMSIINNFSGISYTDAKEISMGVFEDNFYRLSEKASVIAIQRAEELIDSLLNRIKELENNMPGLIEKIENPDVQYTVVNAQKQYARTGGKEKLDIMTSLLTKRFQSDEDSLKSIVLNESLEVISKLTTKQISIVTTIFLVRNCKMANASVFLEALNMVMPYQLIEKGERISFFEHLMYVGVISHDITVMSHQNLEYIIRETYPEELDEYVEESRLDLIEPPIRNQFVTNEERRKVFNNWNSSLMKGYSLTSVGKAIAVAKYNSLFNADIDLGIWIAD